MENNILTAEEFMNSKQFEPDEGITFEEYYGENNVAFVPTIMIAFAKMHVKAALEAASKKNKINLFVRTNRKNSKYKKIENGESYDLIGTRQMWKVDKDSILTAYPENLIK